MARSSYFLLRGVSSACYVSSPPRIVPERHTHTYSHVHKITYLRLTIAPRRSDASPVSSPVQSSLVQSGLGSTGQLASPSNRNCTRKDPKKCLKYFKHPRDDIASIWNCIAFYKMPLSLSFLACIYVTFSKYASVLQE